MYMTPLKLHKVQRRKKDGTEKKDKLQNTPNQSIRVHNTEYKNVKAAPLVPAHECYQQNLSPIPHTDYSDPQKQQVGPVGEFQQRRFQPRARAQNHFSSEAICNVRRLVRSHRLGNGVVIDSPRP